MAWATTSPSEWPARPASASGQCRPATQSSRPGANGWTSTPEPTRGSSADTGSPSPGKNSLCEYEVERPGHLERFVVPGDQEHGHAEQLDQPGVVGHSGSLHLQIMRLQEHRARKALGCLDR